MGLDAHTSRGPWYVHFSNDSASANAVHVSVDGPEDNVIERRRLAAGSPDNIDPACVIAITLLQYRELLTRETNIGMRMRNSLRRRAPSELDFGPFD